ncbi:MAG: T9SS type A sorting domain-containing protein [Fluviicola sp.]
MNRFNTLSATFTFLLYSFLINAQWTQKGADIYGQASQDLFGSSIAMSQDGFIMAVGAPEHSTANGEVGMVRVMEWNGTDWVQRGQDIVGDVEWNKFGHAVALSDDGTVLAIGAPGVSSVNLGVGTIGRAKIFEWNSSNWVQMGATIEYETVFRQFGSAVALSEDGNRLSVGAAWAGQGEVLNYEWDNTDWVQVGTKISGPPPGGTMAGSSIVLSPDGLIVTFGAPRNDGASGNNGSGAVRTYEWDGNDWIQSVDLIPGDSIEDQFGLSISMSYATDTLIIVGAHKNDDNGANTGIATVYKRQGSSWVQHGSSLYGENANDWYGYSVAISGDGTRIIVGGKKHNANGLGSGHGKIYEWLNNDWQLVGEIEGDAPSDECGSAVAMNYNGRIAAIGAPLNDGNWTDAGQVRVYEDGIQGVNNLSSLTINVYPNPVENILHIDGLEEGKVNYAIVDLSGRVILDGELNANSAINVSDLKKGMYTLQLEKDGAVLTEVLVKG